jgi:hypothetical protein
MIRPLTVLEGYLEQQSILMVVVSAKWDDETTGDYHMASVEVTKALVSWECWGCHQRWNTRAIVEHIMLALEMERNHHHRKEVKRKVNILWFLIIGLQNCWLVLEWGMFLGNWKIITSVNFVATLGLYKEK